MLRDLVVIPDTQLLVPGVSGQVAVLQELRLACMENLAAAMTGQPEPKIACFFAPKSKYGRPLPGLVVASEFVSAAGYSCEVLDANIADVEEVTDASVWLVAGSGSAANGDDAPLIADERAPEVDAALREVLREANLSTLSQAIDGVVAREVGATLAEALELAAAHELPATHEPPAAHELPAARYQSKGFREFNEYGVTYFTARWSAGEYALPAHSDL